MSETTNDEVRVHLQYIREGIDGINARLDAQNGRVRKVETDVAVLQDRATDARTTGRNWGAGAGAVGGLLGGFLAGLLGTGAK